MNVLFYNVKVVSTHLFDEEEKIRGIELDKQNQNSKIKP